MLTPWTNPCGQVDEGKLMAQLGSGIPTLVTRGGPVRRRMEEGSEQTKAVTAGPVVFVFNQHLYFGINLGFEKKGQGNPGELGCVCFTQLLVVVT